MTKQNSLFLARFFSASAFLSLAITISIIYTYGVCSCSTMNFAKFCMDTKKGVDRCIYHLEAQHA